MSKSNAKTFALWSIAVILLLQPCGAHKEISGLLDEAKDFTSNEIKALRPLFEELQLQYDFIVLQIPEEELITEKQLQQQYEYEATLKEFEQLLNNMFPSAATTLYNFTLPTAEEITENPDFNLMTQEQYMEFLDMQGILKDCLDEAQININNLVARALSLETNLHKINKPKVVTIIFKALERCYIAAAHVGRAAYCTYSHIPQLNTSLHSLYEGVDCYLFTTSLIAKIQAETFQTIKTVKKNVFELSALYKKVAQQNSLMGKVVSVILNVSRIARNILDTIRTARYVLDSVENQLPTAAHEVIHCGRNFSTKVPFIIESVSNVTECILFVDDTKYNYDFIKSEEEYYITDPNVQPDVVLDEKGNNDIKLL